MERSTAPTPLDALRAVVEEASTALRPDDAPARSAPTLERPKRDGFGDFSTNGAMLLAPSLRRPPREVAEALGREVAERLGPVLERYEVAGPGFLNLFLADAWYADALRAVLAAGGAFGSGGAGTGAERGLLEVVSAHPNRPPAAAPRRPAPYRGAGPPDPPRPRPSGLRG